MDGKETGVDDVRGVRQQAIGVIRGLGAGGKRKRHKGRRHRVMRNGIRDSWLVTRILDWGLGEIKKLPLEPSDT
jgi:hypothetical protein